MRTCKAIQIIQIKRIDILWDFINRPFELIKWNNCCTKSLELGNNSNRSIAIFNSFHMKISNQCKSPWIFPSWQYGKCHVVPWHSTMCIYFHISLSQFSCCFILHPLPPKLLPYTFVGGKPLVEKARGKTFKSQSHRSHHSPTTFSPIYYFQLFRHFSHAKNRISQVDVLECRPNEAFLCLKKRVEFTTNALFHLSAPLHFANSACAQLPLSSKSFSEGASLEILKSGCSSVGPGLSTKNRIFRLEWTKKKYNNLRLRSCGIVSGCPLAIIRLL